MQMTAYELLSSDWSSDVCSSDLPVARDRRDPAVMLDDIKNVARREAGLFVDALEPRRTERPLADRGIDHVGQADIAGVIGRAVDLGGQEIGRASCKERVSK